ncbi:c-type cytochrome [Thioalkalivibrio sp. HK1]|uniref:c-type cytochrome n=1 Tax=Thioalkalivibrio sp. HK1 TaxID=1469245 RepID=UPI0004729F87|nr:c-type cytochrome [Thioalkalivibrio sp. HK1]
MSKADDVFWRQFGMIVVLLTIFGFAMYFLAKAIGSEAYARMQHDPDAIAQRIAPVGNARIGDPEARLAAATPQSAQALQDQSDSLDASASQTDASGENVTMAAADAAGEEIYKSACFACHLSGAGGAPKLEDKSAWETRAAQGFDTLLQSVINGKGAMPPKGGFMHLTDDDLRAAIHYMLDQAGVSADG